MIIGIDLGGMSAKAACLSGEKLSERVRVETSARSSREETASALAGLARAAAEKAGADFSEVEAIGIGSPGVIDGESGVVVNWSNFGWKDVPLARLVSEKTGKRVFVLNDANAAALGEARFGAGKKYRDCAMLTIGTGIGSGVVLGGEIYEGFRGAGAEFGHTVVRAGGRKCPCGRKGCFEVYASTRALIRFTKEAMHAHPESRMWKFAPTVQRAGGRTAFLADAEGDEVARAVISKFVFYLGEGIVNLVNLLRPQAVILGGGISAEGENLLSRVREYVLPRLYVSVGYAPLEIVCASLGNDAGIYGAAAYAASKI